MRDKASPSWKGVKVVTTESGENLLLSCSDLKNLKLMSKSFPEYTGKARSSHTNGTTDIEDLMKEELEGNITEEIRDGIVPHVQDVSVLDTENDIKVKQDETSVKIEYTDDLDEEQMVAAEAYSLL